jgi:hypothetical protein
MPPKKFMKRKPCRRLGKLHKPGLLGEISSRIFAEWRGFDEASKNLTSDRNI